MRFFCVGDEETVRGFRLAGIDGQVVSSAEDADRALSAITSGGDCGVLVLTTAVSLSVPEAVRRLRFGRGRPLLVEVPGPEGRTSGHRGLQRLVQEAVGIRLEERELTG